MGGTFLKNINENGNLATFYGPLVSPQVESTQSLLFGTGGTYQPGVIFSNSSYGMTLRAKQASPGIAHFAFVDAPGNIICTIENDSTFLINTTTASTSNTTGSFRTVGGIASSNVTDAISVTNGGGMTLAGGAAIAKKLFVGGDVNISTGQTLNVGSSGTTSPLNVYGLITGSNGLTISSGTTTLANNLLFSSDAFIGRNTSDAADTGLVVVSGGGGDGSTRGGRIILSGNERPTFGGKIELMAGSTSSIDFYTSDTLRSSISGTGIFTTSNTTTSTSASTGSMVLSGGIGINNTTDATSFTNGGTFTSAGGMGIAKRLFVGESVNALGSVVNGGFDFVLGNTDQTTRGNSGSSRAFVKDTGNILKINFEGDFTGGTFVDSNLRVDGHITTLSLPITFTSTWEVYGDSISAGVGVNSNQIWHYLVKNTLGNTVVNNAVSGYFTHDNTTRIYNQRTFGASRSTAIFIGTNDIRKQITSYTGELDRAFDNCMSCLEAGIVFCALQSANIFNARGATETGTWVDTAVYTGLGRGTNTNGSTSARTVTGRFVAFTVTTTNPANSSTYYGEPFDVSITNFVTDGDNTNGTFSMTNVYAAHEMVTGVVANWSNRCFIFDTGVVGGSHTITITHSANTGTDAFYIDWYAGWDTTSAFNNVLVLGVPPWNYRIDYRGDAGALYQNDTRRASFNKRQEDICHTLRTSFGLPVYYIDTATPDAGGLTADGLHPNFSGQKYIANRVLSVVNNGEYNYV